MKSKYAFLALLLSLVACGGQDSAADKPNVPDVVDSSSAAATPSEPTDTGSAQVTAMTEGPVPPGRHRFTIRNLCEKGDEIGCPKGTVPPPPLDLEVTVPAGWQHWPDFGVITPDTDDTPTEGPDGAALVMGWTTFQVGLNSDPCITDVDGHEVPDIKVGPTVDDFVDAVQAHKGLDVTEPVDTEVGGYRARLFSLEGPPDISACDNWRPWDPGFFVQGPNNHWDVWAIDVDGDRVLIVTQHFPDTPEQTVDELGDMVETITFQP
jgi:hypothetical protein